MNKTIAIACGLVLLGGPAARGVSLQWTRQFGTSNTDSSLGVSADGLGNVYISGYTFGSLAGTSAGNADAFVSKYNAAGNQQWTRQLGTSSEDRGNGVSADGLGNVYISGYTYGSLGGPNVGIEDAFVAKYDAAGNQQWTRQIGTTGNDDSNGVSADGLGNVYVSGRTGGDLGGANGQIDAYVRKYDAAGNQQWTRQLGTSSYDSCNGVSADGLGNVFITGWTVADLGGTNAGGEDAFVSKYDAAGNQQWTRQLGTSANEEVFGVSADGLGNVYISGVTNGNLGATSAGGADAFVSKYNAAGNLQWTRQLGTNVSEESFGVSADGLGNVYISGWTVGDLGGPNAGNFDAFVTKYDASGNLQWTRQLGTSDSDTGYGVSADGLGNVYTSGVTQGSLGGPNVGSLDTFIAKFSEAIPGDYNGNGIVDAADYTVWRDSLGKTGTGLAADGDGNGSVNTLDYDFWKSRFGNHAGSGAGDNGSGAVPELSSLMLLLTGCVAGMVARRR